MQELDNNTTAHSIYLTKVCKTLYAHTTTKMSGTGRFR